MKLANPIGRSTEEWIGVTADTPIPEYVRIRVFERYGGKCYLTGKRLMPGEYDIDHIKSLKNGGQNRESNLAPIWRKRHREKTAQENSEGAKADRIKAKHFGQKRKGSIPSRPFPKRIYA